VRDPYRKVRHCAPGMRNKNEDAVVESPTIRVRLTRANKPGLIGVARHVNNSDIGGTAIRHLQIFLIRSQKADALNDKDFRPSSSVAR
jgi:hypothetical protein